ncbi:MAG: ATP-binding protein [Crocinitomicaceae bacterium]|nr:ATP-binding protein [Crocinitomicaceae bacterium]
MIIKVFKRYKFLIAAIVCTLLFVGTFFSILSENYSSETSFFNSTFLAKEKHLEEVLRYRKDDIRKKGLDEFWTRIEGGSDVNLHVYSNDSLVFWNTNQLPIIRFADIHYPAEGILHLQNGWYYAKILEIDDFLICASFILKHDYTYENKELVNQFSAPFSLPFSASISLEEEIGYQIKDGNGDFVLSIVPDELQDLSHTQSVLLMMLFLATFILWLVWCVKTRVRLISRLRWLIPIVVIGLQALALHFEWLSFMSVLDTYDPSLYATNHWFPNFFAYLLNVAIIVYLMYELTQFLKGLEQSVFKAVITVGMLITSFGVWSLFLYLNKSLIENSSIPLIIDKLFSLNVYSIFAITSFGAYFFAYYLFIRGIFEACKEVEIKPTQVAMVTFFMSCGFLLYEVNYGYSLFFGGVFPMILYGLVFFLVYRRRKVQQLGAGLILLLLFSIVTAINIGEFNRRKEREERELYANQLATEKDVVTEIEYASLAPKLLEDKFLQKFISSPQPISVSDFQEGMERRLFKKYWERYEMKISLFDAAHNLMIEDRKDTGGLYDELQGIINRSGVVSEIDSNIFYIQDYSDQYSYIIRQRVLGKNGENEAMLFCTLKSKKIPEEIGFPRLLISSTTNVLEPLENYSIAKFHNDDLIADYGGFNYPSSLGAMIPKGLRRQGFFDYGDFNHYILKKTSKDAVVLSTRNFRVIDLITSFSYLFSFYGLLLLPLMFRLNSRGRFRRTLSLAMKIQVVLISLVFLSLLAFGWGSGVFVSNQYNQYTDEVIREKLNSVQTEVRAKLGHFEHLSISDNGNYMQYILKKFAKVFFTDINMYDNDGYLLATSRPKVFNSGLLSEQMNPLAYKYMKYSQKSEFVHDESIGSLDYSSAYLPFYNNNGDRMGFINLQHFGQQRGFENQIQKFLVAIINVFILLLAISIVLAIFISNWLTSPLRILQESFAGVKFGKHNEQISYDKEDEIGALVKDYNQKLEELEFTAQQLAKSERESAWREMAKQVAHEIKNPLTPMKLSVQHLLRTYDPMDPKSGDKLKKVSNSIIEQIDSLTKIANEFSSFAKMPNPSEQKINLVALVKSTTEVFTGDTRSKITVSSSQEEIYVMADKNQFVRVFNNLVKNAMQAIPSDRKGIIGITMLTEKDKVVVKISDNGVGIDESKRSKIFVPYFTTKSTGTGLGLAMVKQIIENHKGSIFFDTKIGEGTTFEIILPRTD